MRLIFLGTPSFAVPSLEALIVEGHPVLGVVTQPDRPRGRGQMLAESPVKACALKHGLPVFQPERIRRPEAVEYLSELAPEIMVVVGYGQIIPQRVIDIAPRGIINVHASLLPRLRGAAPVQWAIARGEAVTGVTTMQIDAGLDTGDMLLKRETRIGPEEDAVMLGARLSHIGAGLLIDTLHGLSAGTIRPEKQDSALATYAPILTKADGLIRWEASAQDLHNQIRGMQPWPGAHTTFRGQTLRIPVSRMSSDRSEKWEPGTVRLLTDGLFVCAGDERLLRLVEVQMEGRRAMSGEEFARGQRISGQDRLGS